MLLSPISGNRRMSTMVGIEERAAALLSVVLRRKPRCRGSKLVLNMIDLLLWKEKILPGKVQTTLL
jgi:hypothetical protein